MKNIICPYCNSPAKQITDHSFYNGKLYDTNFNMNSLLFFNEKAFLCENSDLPMFIGFELYGIEAISVYHKISANSLIEVTNLYKSQRYNNGFYINKINYQIGYPRTDSIYSNEINRNKHFSIQEIETITNFS